MKHIKVIELKNNLTAVSSLKGFDVNYAIQENLERLEAAIKPLATQEKEVEKLLESFLEEKKKISEEFAVVDGEVKYKTIETEFGKQSIYDIPLDKMADFNSKMLELKEKHKDNIVKYEEERVKFNDFIENGDSSFQLFTVKSNHVPSDITTENLKLIFTIIRKKED